MAERTAAASASPPDAADTLVFRPLKVQSWKELASSHKDWLQRTGMLGFVQLKLKELDPELVKKATEGYDVDNRSLHLEGLGSMAINEETVGQALHLPYGPGLEEIPLEYNTYSHSAEIQKYFTDRGYSSGIGWKLCEAKDYTMKLFLEFLTRRIGHVKNYRRVSGVIAYPACASRSTGKTFNWSQFLCAKIHKELKERKPCSTAHYISMIIQHHFKLPSTDLEPSSSGITEEGSRKRKSRPSRDESNGDEQVDRDRDRDTDGEAETNDRLRQLLPRTAAQPRPSLRSGDSSRPPVPVPPYPPPWFHPPIFGPGFYPCPPIPPRAPLLPPRVPPPPASAASRLPAPVPPRGSVSVAAPSLPARPASATVSAPGPSAGVSAPQASRPSTAAISAPGLPPASPASRPVKPRAPPASRPGTAASGPCQAPPTAGPASAAEQIDGSRPKKRKSSSNRALQDVVDLTTEPAAMQRTVPAQTTSPTRTEPASAPVTEGQNEKVMYSISVVGGILKQIEESVLQQKDSLMSNIWKAQQALLHLRLPVPVPIVGVGAVEQSTASCGQLKLDYEAACTERDALREKVLQDNIEKERLREKAAQACKERDELKEKVVELKERYKAAEELHARRFEDANQRLSFIVKQLVDSRQQQEARAAVGRAQQRKMNQLRTSSAPPANPQERPAEVHSAAPTQTASEPPQQVGELLSAPARQQEAVELPLPSAPQQRTAQVRPVLQQHIAEREESSPLTGLGHVNGVLDFDFFPQSPAPAARLSNGFLQGAHPTSNADPVSSWLFAPRR